MRQGLKLIAVLALASLPLNAGDSVEFNRDIRPILPTSAITCHGPMPRNRKTKLRFDHRKRRQDRAEQGPHRHRAGRSAQSEMYRRISSDNNAHPHAARLCGRATS